MEIKEYYLYPDKKRPRQLVPVLHSVYDLSGSMEIIFGELYLQPAEVLDLLETLKQLKELRAKAQLDTDTHLERKGKLDNLRNLVLFLNIWLANKRCILCLAYKESKDCLLPYQVTDKSPVPPPALGKGQLRIQITMIFESLTMRRQDYNSWLDNGYKGPQTIEGIKRMLDYSGRWTTPVQKFGTPRAKKRDDDDEGDDDNEEDGDDDEPKKKSNKHVVGKWSSTMINPDNYQGVQSIITKTPKNSGPPKKMTPPPKKMTPPKKSGPSKK